MRFTVFLLLAAFAVPATQGAIYKWVGQDGSVYYSDQPFPGAVEIQLPPLPPARQPRVRPSSPMPKLTLFRYQGLAIRAPGNGTTVRDNAGNVDVNVSITPGLNIDEGHRLQMVLDGRLVGTPSPSTKQTLANVDRGAHRLEAQVINKYGRTLIKSSPVTFYLHRQSGFSHPAPVFPGRSGAVFLRPPGSPAPTRAPRAGPGTPAAPIPGPDPRTVPHGAGLPMGRPGNLPLRRAPFQPYPIAP